MGPFALPLTVQLSYGAILSEGRLPLLTVGSWSPQQPGWCSTAYNTHCLNCCKSNTDEASGAQRHLVTHPRSHSRFLIGLGRSWVSPLPQSPALSTRRTCAVGFSMDLSEPLRGRSFFLRGTDWLWRAFPWCQPSQAPGWTPLTNIVVISPWHSAKHFHRQCLAEHQNKPVQWPLLASQFTDEEREAQRGQAARPRSHSSQVARAALSGVLLSHSCGLPGLRRGDTRVLVLPQPGPPAILSHLTSWGLRFLIYKTKAVTTKDTIGLLGILSEIIINSKCFEKLEMSQ